MDAAEVATFLDAIAVDPTIVDPTIMDAIAVDSAVMDSAIVDSTVDESLHFSQAVGGGQVLLIFIWAVIAASRHGHRVVFFLDFLNLSTEA